MKLNLPDNLLRFIKETENELNAPFDHIANIALKNQSKMLDAFQEAKVRSYHFQNSTGYGYHDLGRETLEKIFSRVFGAESALVRQQLVSGTHAIACALLGNLHHHDELVLASGQPYETLLGVLGISGTDFESTSETGGFHVKMVPLTNDGSLDLSNILSAISNRTKIVAFQRSCGYSERHSFSIHELEKVFTAIKTKFPEIIIFVDNCYGEFVEEKEPTEVGADLIAGSLIKNPGGCLIPSGGYIVGKEKCVIKAAERLYAPKIGGEIGPSLLNLQIFFQGFFEAPHRVGEMVKSAVLASCMFHKLGFRVNPLPEETRTDIIQRVYFETAESLIDFCQEVQKSSPVESDVRPEPAELPGYIHRVIMGGGTFIAGATSEFSVDAPLKPPYLAYLQGGISYTQVKLSLARIFMNKFAQNGLF
ncbi:cystathionine beta-lyase family protein involved in aluminum resistance [Hydrogenispora ethanolica]|jgi:cystathionine beta-lyase family protein involved in aluminum resistance|uniref:Cystathionine beta-lyase family protein involved in aluminum resistance n=1 Tax=Hydrogenispora ethanolica TaxID=1082276 RepID=A0A4R1R469_HYDET|nr:methionine gamma-lyase family protein [Hydrogenispora ethanolica]TCL60254.1 cystathionine beta-lyase family protein involved in aluminum resistance [Hydrogenispora ethanolica]